MLLSRLTTSTLTGRIHLIPSILSTREQFTVVWRTGQNCAGVPSSTIPSRCSTTLRLHVYRACKPGGWFESVETTVEVISDDGSVTEESVVAQWTSLAREAGEKMGRTFQTNGRMGPWMRGKLSPQSFHIHIHACLKAQN